MKDVNKSLAFHRKAGDKNKTKKLITLNWKMNPSTLKEAIRLFKETAELARGFKKNEIIICPPFIYLSDLTKFQVLSSKFQIGAQNCFWEQKGAYTGEISPLALKNLGVRYVILGHSERRENFGETDEIINKKIQAGLKSGLKVIFCVGEKERDEYFDYFNFVKEEIEHGLKGISENDLKNIAIAYEPIWAISSIAGAKAITPDNLLEMAIVIRRIIFNIFKTKKIFEVPILYGGSVDDKNFKDFLNVDGISGLLIGAASLKPKELKKMTDF